MLKMSLFIAMSIVLSLILMPLIIHFCNKHNLYVGPNVSIGPNAHISANNAKFICKGHTAIAENLTVHTGNHARLIGQYVTDIKEADKPHGYDKDVIVYEDVWIGSNVTLLAGVSSIKKF